MHPAPGCTGLRRAVVATQGLRPVFISRAQPGYSDDARLKDYRRQDRCGSVSSLEVNKSLCPAMNPPGMTAWQTWRSHYFLFYGNPGCIATPSLYVCMCVCIYIYIQVLTASQNAFLHTTGVFSIANCNQSWNRAGIQASAGRQFNLS